MVNQTSSSRVALWHDALLTGIYNPGSNGEKPYSIPWWKSPSKDKIDRTHAHTHAHTHARSHTRTHHKHTNLCRDLESAHLRCTRCTQFDPTHFIPAHSSTFWRWWKCTLAKRTWCGNTTTWEGCYHSLDYLLLSCRNTRSLQHTHIQQHKHNTNAHPHMHTCTHAQIVARTYARMHTVAHTYVHTHAHTPVPFLVPGPMENTDDEVIISLPLPLPRPFSLSFPLHPSFCCFSFPRGEGWGTGGSFLTAPALTRIITAQQ